MTDPQSGPSKKKPPRAEPWQPDRPGSGDERIEEESAAVRSNPPSRRTETAKDARTRAAQPVEHATTDSLRPGESVPSPEAAIPRDPQTGQALHDRSLVSGDESELSDGRSGSTHLPES